MAASSASDDAPARLMATVAAPSASSISAKKGCTTASKLSAAQALLTRIVEQKLLRASAVYGLWPAASVGDDIVYFADEERGEQIARFNMLRQQADHEDGRPNLSLADFVAPLESGLRDYAVMPTAERRRRTMAAIDLLRQREENQPAPAAPRAQPFDPLPDFAQREHAQKQDRFIRRIYPADQFVIGLRLDQFGDDARVEQEAAHSLTGLARSRGRSSEMPEPAKGDSAKNCARLP